MYNDDNRHTKKLKPIGVVPNKVAIHSGVQKQQKSNGKHSLYHSVYDEVPHGMDWSISVGELLWMSAHPSGSNSDTRMRVCCILNRLPVKAHLYAQLKASCEQMRDAPNNAEKMLARARFNRLSTAYVRYVGVANTMYAPATVGSEEQEETSFTATTEGLLSLRPDEPNVRAGQTLYADLPLDVAMMGEALDACNERVCGFVNLGHGPRRQRLVLRTLPQIATTASREEHLAYGALVESIRACGMLVGQAKADAGPAQPQIPVQLGGFFSPIVHCK